MRTPPLLADIIHARVCKPICAKFLTLPKEMVDNIISTFKIIFYRLILHTLFFKLANTTMHFKTLIWRYKVENASIYSQHENHIHPHNCAFRREHLI